MILILPKLAKIILIKTPYIMLHSCFPIVTGLVNVAFKLKQCGKSNNPPNQHSRTSTTVSAETVNSKLRDNSTVRQQELPIKMKALSTKTEGESV